MSDHFGIINTMRQSNRLEPEPVDLAAVSLPTLKRCPACQETNPAEALFCVHCDECFDPSIGQVNVRSWVRYWARHIDMYCYGILSIIAPFPLLLLAPADKIFLILYMVEIIAINLLGGWILIEALLLSTWGTTPGKWLFKTRLRQNDDSNLSFKQAALRALKVWVKGLGLGLPLVSLFTYLGSKTQLDAEKQTSWDREGAFTVTHQPIGALRTIIGIVFLLIAAILVTALQIAAKRGFS